MNPVEDSCLVLRLRVSRIVLEFVYEHRECYGSECDRAEYKRQYVPNEAFTAPRRHCVDNSRNEYNERDSENSRHHPASDS